MKTVEQLEVELEYEKRKNELLIASHLERQISDGRYAMKWVEKALVWGLYTVAGVVLVALLGTILIHK